MTRADAQPRPRLPWVRFAVVAALVALDLWTKRAAFEFLRGTPPELVDRGLELWHGHWRYPLIGDFLGLMASENKGAAWGLGDGVPWLLIGARVVASVVLTVLLWRAPASQPWSRAALALILAGALGNLWDNLARTPPPDHPFGAVRDFIQVYFASFDYAFPTFNVADSCITVGAAILIVTGLFGGRSAEEGAEPAGAAGTAGS
jgi:signal peptidase II